MKSVFADTFFFLAMLGKEDELRAQATEVSRRIPARMVTTVWVLTEVADALCRPGRRALFLDLLARLRGGRDVAIVPATDELFEAGVQLFARRPDKDWSLTDCISFVVMERGGISDALTGDRHFEQAGFNALLRQAPTQ